MPHHPSETARRAEARAMLEHLLPAARRLAAESTDATALVPGSDVGEVALPHYRLDACVGVEIYQGEKGGWFADLVFEGLPAGIPDVFGTPVQEPLPGPEEAAAYAVEVLALLMAQADRPKPDRENFTAAFPFDDISVPLPAKFLAELREATAMLASPPTREDALERLAQFRAEALGGEPLTVERANGLSPDLRVRLAVVSAVALLSGVVRYPEFEEAAPPPPGPKH